MTLPDGQSPTPRVLCVLDNDFGDLAFVMYFLQGQPLADRATILLPPRLADRDDGRLPVATRRYSSGEDILRAVDEVEPDAVLLLSGYMLAIHGLLSREELPGLVERLRARCRVVTGDPFLGLVSDGRLSARFGISIPVKSARARLYGLIHSYKLIQHLRTARRAFQHVPHLYQLPFLGTGNQPGATLPERISFYNPELVAAYVEGDREREGSGPPEWLFILGWEDTRLQAMLHGIDRFLALLADRLEETVDVGRTPVLIASERLLDQVRPLISRPDRMRLLSFIAYGDFAALMSSAEYVFYWNVISYSSLLRIVRDRPFFIFHAGHLVHNVKGLRERVRSWYYQGWEPALLDQTKPLDPGRLDAMADDFREASSRIRTALSRVPTPMAVMENLLGGR